MASIATATQINASLGEQDSVATSEVVAIAKDDQVTVEQVVAIPVHDSRAAVEQVSSPTTSDVEVALSQATATSEGSSSGCPTCGCSCRTADPPARQDPASDLDATTAALLAKFNKKIRVGIPIFSILVEMGKARFDYKLCNFEFSDRDIKEAYRPAFEAATEGEKTTASEEIVYPVSIRKKAHLTMMSSSDSASSPPVLDIWYGADLDGPVADETHQAFAILFSKHDRKSENPSCDTKATRASSARSCFINYHRDQNITIMLKSLWFPHEDFRKRVVTMHFDGDEAKEKLCSLQANWPSKDQVHAIATYTGDGSDLGLAERFLVSLCVVPRCQEMIECLQYRLGFQDRVVKLKEKMWNVTRFCEEIRGEKFQGAMHRILRLVILNDRRETNSTSAHRGFPISTLSQIQEARTFSPSVSVLRAIVEDMKTDYSGICDLSRAKAGVGASIASFRSELKSLKDGRQKVVDEATHAGANIDGAISDKKVVDDLKMFRGAALDFTKSVEGDLMEVETILDNLAKQCKELKAYLGEPEATSINDIAKQIADFGEAFETELKQQVEQIELEEKSPVLSECGTIVSQVEQVEVSVPRTSTASSSPSCMERTPNETDWFTMVQELSDDSISETE